MADITQGVQRRVRYRLGECCSRPSAVDKQEHIQIGTQVIKLSLMHQLWRLFVVKQPVLSSCATCYRGVMSRGGQATVVLYES